jgi:L-alanine-DL-glutamate epimerase-like enolase superfamily enzyme
VSIGLAAGTHLVATTPAITPGCQFYMPRYVLAPQECEASLTIVDGKVVVPSGPGLGIDVDQDILDAITKERWT